MKTSKMKFGINYVDTKSPLHGLNGITKFALLMAWITVVLTTFDLRIIVVMILLGLTLLKTTGVAFQVYKPLLLGTLSVLTTNAIFMFAVAPQQGSEVLGTTTELMTLPGNYTLTQETLYYLCTVTLKYFSMFPIALVFVFTTHPTEFASSLNRVGVPYKIAYAVSLTLRYLPEVKNDFVNIMHAQQARGVDFSKNAPLMDRFRGVTKILIPLIFSSLDRADEISNAMTLRGFGRYNSRTWYNQRVLTSKDWGVLAILALGVTLALIKRNADTVMMWYPFG
ncbi:energy-coupling factor transporter transmembrane protein EcfT [Enterovibrio sp. ZSDZ35]|uniref:Energy-coupling factor transporter transmembrane protein EcfT n=1 Tax=Enterovibrio qingdaonensis TaxID=2899818 RepID=A0ABT5QSL7_9GAMM|nr:energy-coupling factor transporter transmembrane component T [Enterovibrio sp. ZSDZ35]MDD1783693.1 energy-coupling factor transporter transmembrane protein EcfT [Enterovibrio sp. ZSDZ35]